MNDDTSPATFRTAVLAVSLTLLTPRGLPNSLRVAGQRLAQNILRRLDARRARLDPDLLP
ncbi:MAG TPA: hypothetical protein PKA64_11765 [Myxococcota bacterium]|nr:hypothetical protein [Myxococcota bacterium]